MGQFDHAHSLIFKNGNFTPFLPKSLAPGFDANNAVFPSLAPALGAIMGEDPDVIHADYRALPAPDLVSSLDLTTSTGAPTFGHASDRLWNGTDHTSRIVSHLNGTGDGYRMALGSSLTPLLESFAAIVVFRIPSATASCTLIGKRSGADLNGWNLSVLSDGRVFAQLDHGGAHRSTIVPGSVIGNDWHVAMIRVNRDNNTLYARTESGFATGTIAGYGAINSTDEAFGHGLCLAFPAPSTTAEIAYSAYWAGAKAENLGAAELTAFWQPQLDNPPA